MEKNMDKTIKRWKYNLLVINLHIIYNSTSETGKWCWKITPKTRI